MDDEGDGATTAREIGNVALVATMDGRRRLMTEGAGCYAHRRVGDDCETLGPRNGVRDPQPTPLREEGDKVHLQLLRESDSGAKECRMSGSFHRE